MDEINIMKHKKGGRFIPVAFVYSADSEFLFQTAKILLGN
jgi:hypothetical protein